MLATVPMRCMSIGAGSVASGSRCMRMPTWRWSRTACWAAAIDFGRPSVIGSIRPGNSTVLRTGTMMSASGGSGGRVEPFCAGSLDDSISTSATVYSRFLQRDHHQAVGDGAAHAAVATARQRQSPIEAPLRQLEAMDGCRAQFARIGARPSDDQLAVLDHRLGAVAIDSGQRDEHQDLPLG